MTYEEHHAALLQYLRVKVEQSDWHAVWDPIDLKTIEVQRTMEQSCKAKTS